MGKILAVDLGEVRTGIALSDSSQTIAMPLKVISGKNLEKLLEAIVEIVCEEQVVEVIVGNPINMNGTKGKKSQKCVRIADLLSEKLELKYLEVPVKLWDERLTTAGANVFMNMDDRRGKKRKESIDAVAASLILEAYLGSLE
ncbi:MAG: Holliday junction resolvase RuvX [Oscillospiraceae bacterium]|nr:Holliday junction resolvase RuvX [Oscillospiraceae bacterium]